MDMLTEIGAITAKVQSVREDYMSSETTLINCDERQAHLSQVDICSVIQVLLTKNYLRNLETQIVPTNILICWWFSFFMRPLRPMSLINHGTQPPPPPPPSPSPDTHTNWLTGGAQHCWYFFLWINQWDMDKLHYLAQLITSLSLIQCVSNIKYCM